MRQYESALIESESVALLEQLKTDISVSLVVANASKLLRSILRLLGGEEPESAGTPPEYDFLGLQIIGEMDKSLDRECELHRLPEGERGVAFIVGIEQNGTSKPPFDATASPARINCTPTTKDSEQRQSYELWRLCNDNRGR